MASFLDSAGVTRLVTKLKTIFAVKATTLSGYGITNGVSSVSVTGTGQAVSAASISGHTLTLTKGASLPTVRHERPHIDLHPGLQLHQLRGAHPRPHRRLLLSRGEVLDQFPPYRHHARIRPLPWMRHHGRADLHRLLRRHHVHQGRRHAPGRIGLSFHALHQWQERTIPGQGLRPVAAHLGLVNDNNKTITRKYNYSSLLIHKTVWQSISIPQA